MRHARWGFVSTRSPLIALLALAGCATPRPDPGIACRLYTQVARPPVAAPLSACRARCPRGTATCRRGVEPAGADRAERRRAGGGQTRAAAHAAAATTARGDLRDPRAVGRRPVRCVRQRLPVGLGRARRPAAESSGRRRAAARCRRRGAAQQAPAVGRCGQCRQRRVRALRPDRDRTRRESRSPRLRRRCDPRVGRDSGGVQPGVHQRPHVGRRRRAPARLLPRVGGARAARPGPEPVRHPARRSGRCAANDEEQPDRHRVAHPDDHDRSAAARLRVLRRRRSEAPGLSSPLDRGRQHELRRRRERRDVLSGTRLVSVDGRIRTSAAGRDDRQAAARRRVSNEAAGGTCASRRHVIGASQQLS